MMAGPSALWSAMVNRTLPVWPPKLLNGIWMNRGGPVDTCTVWDALPTVTVSVAGRAATATMLTTSKVPKRADSLPP
jgi:hypothetical protein